LAIDDNLLKAAFVMGGLKTKKDTVNLALEVIIGPIQQKLLSGISGKKTFLRYLQNFQLYSILQFEEDRNGV
jgi:Arc/MetJ family transcription regulator